METAKPPARAGNLTAALVVVGLLELALNRLGGRLFFPRATLSMGGGSAASGAIAATPVRCDVSSESSIGARRDRST